MRGHSFRSKGIDTTDVEYIEFIFCRNVCSKMQKALVTRHSSRLTREVIGS